MPELPGFVARGDLIFEAPVGDLLRCFVAQRSRWNPRAVYVACIVLPLAKPVDAVVFIYGDRLVRGSHLWEIDPQDPAPAMESIRDAIVREGLPALAAIPDSRALAEWLRAWRLNDPDRLNTHFAEAEAYSWIVAGEHGMADDVIGFVAASGQNDPDEPLWAKALRDRCALARRLLATDFRLALDLLRILRTESVMALGLEEWATPDPFTSIDQI